MMVIEAQPRAGLSCPATRHHAIMRDPARREAETHDPQPQTAGAVLLGWHRRCRHCDKQLFQPALPVVPR